MIGVTVADNLVILLEECTKKDTSSGKVPKHKGCSHFYKGNPDEEDEEEFMAAMCHQAATYSSNQVNREDDKYFKQ